MRRIALAEELIGDPAFLFLDELTSGLDPYSEHELMVWLKELAHGLNKTIVLVTHAVSNLRLCDSVVLLHEGRLCFQGPYDELLRSARDRIDRGDLRRLSACLGRRATSSASMRTAPANCPPPPEPHALNTAPPPGSLSQLFTLVRRQYILLWRDKAQLWLHLALLVTFPALVAIFATNGLPQVRSMSLDIADQHRADRWPRRLDYMQESFSRRGAGFRPGHVPGHPAHAHGREQRRARNRQGTRRARKGIARGAFALGLRHDQGLARRRPQPRAGVLDDLVRQDGLRISRAIFSASSRFSSSPRWP